MNAVYLEDSNFLKPLCLELNISHVSGEKYWHISNCFGISSCGDIQNSALDCDKGLLSYMLHIKPTV